MPALINKTLFKKRLAESYSGNILLTGKYTNTTTQTKFACVECKHTWETKPWLLISGGKPRKYGCPKCARIGVGKSNSARETLRKAKGIPKSMATYSKYIKKVQTRWFDSIDVLHFTSVNDKVEVKCNCCNYRWKPRSSFYDVDEYPCPMCAGYDSYNDITESQSNFIITCYSELCFSLPQISYLMGISEYTIRQELKDNGILFINGDHKRSGTSLKYKQKGRSITDQQRYLYNARRITNYIKKKYKHTIPSSELLLEKGYHLDHILSVYDGFVSYDFPIDLKILCHPANLQVLNARDNASKNRSSWFTRDELILNIKKYTKKYGAIDFPEGFEYEYKKEIDISKLPSLTIMGLDPGSKNFGIFVGKIQGKSSITGLTTLHSGILEYPISELKSASLGRDIERFTQELGYYYDKFMPDLVVIERFVARGIKGKINETVNVMIGLILSQALGSYCDAIPVIRTVTPASWKNNVNRVIDLKALYIQGKDLGIAPHMIDSCLMGLNFYPTEKVYSFLKRNKTRFLKSLKDEKPMVIK